MLIEKSVISELGKQVSVVVYVLRLFTAPATSGWLVGKGKLSLLADTIWTTADGGVHLEEDPPDGGTRAGETGQFSERRNGSPPGH